MIFCFSNSCLLKDGGILKRNATIFAAILSVTSAFVSIAMFSSTPPAHAEQASVDAARKRFAHLRHGINLSHWFAQSTTGNYSKEHLDTFTTAEDIALIKTMGFDHVRFTVE